MKARIPTALLGRTLQAASTIWPTAPDLEHTDVVTASLVREHETHVIDEDFRVFAGEEQQSEASPPATFAFPQEWNTKSAARFKDLVEKEALGTAMPEEIAQLESLAGLRRRAVIPRTGEEVLREYEQGQLVRDLLRSLTRYVEFANQSNDGPSKARTRAKAKTSGA
jgi:hypothetical protein